MQRTLIWDLPTRLFHWALAGSFAIAWLTSDGDRWLSIHVFLGYLMLGLVVFRLVWGFTGSHFSRFASFWFGPRQALDYLKQVARAKAPRHVGHNPSGSLAIYLLLAMAAMVGLTGILTLGGDEQQGIAAGWFSFAQIRWVKDLHEAGATLMLALVVGHITGVVVESVLHRENLSRAMVTGFKMAAPGTPRARPHIWVAALMLLAMLGFGGWWFAYADDLGDDLSEAPQVALLKFMVANAAEEHAVEAGYMIEQSIPAGETPLRITGTPSGPCLMRQLRHDLSDQHHLRPS